MKFTLEGKINLRVLILLILILFHYEGPAKAWRIAFVSVCCRVVTTMQGLG
ncbi:MULTISPECIES: hypothetical protein [Lysobacteraceae]|uniref:hypothetical protein n=1 Tax=Lysobacteraceae TaxID=32033 RepID=UPI001BCB241A|nr:MULTISPECIES: hypothetical protein [Lysobacter]